jgi:dTDP-4-dehydrorhamnose 3,5-epimerase
MKVTPTKFSEVLLIEPCIFADSRGYFLETYRTVSYSDHGIPPFFQDNLSYSRKGALRGLHYQLGRPQGKLVWVIQGVIFDVVVDIRQGSKNFGKWQSMILDSQYHKQLYIPKGFAHGFCVTSDSAIVFYKCTDYYAPQEERGIRWDDPALGIDWPIAEPILSLKDQAYPRLSDVPVRELPVMKGRQCG